MQLIKNQSKRGEKGYRNAHTFNQPMWKRLVVWHFLSCRSKRDNHSESNHSNQKKKANIVKKSFLFIWPWVFLIINSIWDDWKHRPRVKFKTQKDWKLSGRTQQKPPPPKKNKCHGTIVCWKWMISTIYSFPRASPFILKNQSTTQMKM